MFPKTIFIASIFLIALILPFFSTEAVPPTLNLEDILDLFGTVPTPSDMPQPSVPVPPAVAAPDLKAGECYSNTDCGAGEVCHCDPDRDKGKKGICGPAGKEIVCPFSIYTSIEQLIKAIGDKIFYFAVIICPLLIVVGAFLFLTSAGDPGRTKLGKDIIKWSVIGLAVILFSKGLYSIIKHILTG